MAINNTNQKLLTIAIPTYNRVTFLVECLEHVLSQLVKEDCDVEILVSDNASSDETPTIMKNLCENYPCIRYIRNKTNVGADGNFLNCLREARGRFVHLLSDDDILLPSSISKIKEFIKKYPDMKLIYLNTCAFADTFDINNEYSIQYKITENVIYDNPNKFIEDIHIMLTFVSALVFNKESVNEISQPEKYLGTNLLQAHLALKCIGSGKNALISHVCVAARIENSGGYDFCKVFVYEWKKVLFETGLQAGFSKLSLEKVFKITLKKFISPMVKKLRLNKKKDFGMKRSILFKYTWNYPEAWMRVFPYAFLPKIFFVRTKKLELFFKKLIKR